VAAQIDRVLHWALRWGRNEAVLELHPPEWGRIRIRMRWRRGRLDLHLQASEPQVARLLEDRRSELQGLLQQAGWELGEWTTEGHPERSPGREPGRPAPPSPGAAPATTPDEGPQLLWIRPQGLNLVA
jgi:hypothetical protein